MFSSFLCYLGLVLVPSHAVPVLSRYTGAIWMRSGKVWDTIYLGLHKMSIALSSSFSVIFKEKSLKVFQTQMKWFLQVPRNSSFLYQRMSGMYLSLKLCRKGTNFRFGLTLNEWIIKISDVFASRYDIKPIKYVTKGMNVWPVYLISGKSFELSCPRHT